MTLLRAPGLGLSLFVFWLVLSGHFEPLLIGLGVASTVLVVFVSHRMGLIDSEGVSIAVAGRFAAYFVWLMKEVAVSNLHVARIILDPRLPISPVLVTYHVSQRTDLGRVIYANSITLTPGTITCGVRGDQLEVHSLTWVDVDGREEDQMDRWASWVEPDRK